MIKISKNLLFNPIQIRISGVKCNSRNITKVVNVFNYKRVMVTIDSLTKDSSLLSLIKKKGLEYFVNRQSVNYVELSVIVPYFLFEDILGDAISEKPENIFILHLLDQSNEDVYPQYSFENLVINGIANMFISISFDENALLILANKYLLQPQDIYRKIKTLQFD